MNTTEPSLSGGGHLAAKPSDDDAGMDRLSVLPDSVLLHVLAGLGDAAAAGRTSVLSSRWRRLWALLLELRFPLSREPCLIASALAAHEAELRHLDVTTQDAGPEPVAAWLRVAARRLSGSLVFTNQAPGTGSDAEGDGEGRSAFDELPCLKGAAARDDDVDDTEGRGAFELHCLDRATSVSFDLGRLGLTAPRAGAFARLTELSLTRARVPGGGPCALGDAVSSRRCPCLQRLTIRDARGLEDFTVRSDSLRRMELTNVRDLRQLAIVAPALEHLQVLACFYHHWPQRRPVATITARQLKVLKWGDPFDRRSVQLGKMKHLQAVCPELFLVYACWSNKGCLEFLRCFNNIQTLSLTLIYPPDISNKPCLLKNMKMLPGVTFLNLSVISNGHAFGASLFHVLRLCPGTRNLTLYISGGNSLEKQTACPPGCICDEQQDWKFEELLLNNLQEVKITELRGFEHEVIFVKYLLGWATELKKMTIIFHSLVTESMARKSYQMLRRFSRLEISMEFYMDKCTMMVPYVLKD